MLDPNPLPCIRVRYNKLDIHADKVPQSMPFIYEDEKFDQFEFKNLEWELRYVMHWVTKLPIVVLKWNCEQWGTVCPEDEEVVMPYLKMRMRVRGKLLEYQREDGGVVGEIGEDTPWGGVNIALVSPWVVTAASPGGTQEEGLVSLGYDKAFEDDLRAVRAVRRKQREHREEREQAERDEIELTMKLEQQEERDNI